MKKSLPLAHELLLNGARTNRCTQGKKTSGDPFGKAHEVGNYVRQFAGKHRATAAKAGQDLIRDQQHVMFRRQRANTLQELYRMNNHPASPLQQRLDDDCGNPVAAILKQLCQGIGTFDAAGSTGLPYRTAVAIRRMNPVHGKPQSIKRLGETGVCAYGHSAHRIAMIGMLQSHDFFFVVLSAVLPILNRQLQGNFHRRRAVVREKNMLQRWRQKLAQLGRNCLNVGMAKPGEQHMIEHLGLFGHRRTDFRMTMAMQVHPPRRNGVQNLTAVVGIQIHTRSAHDAQRLGINMRLSKRMPDFEGRGHDFNAWQSKQAIKTCLSVHALISESCGTMPITRTRP